MKTTWSVQFIFSQYILLLLKETMILKVFKLDLGRKSEKLYNLNFLLHLFVYLFVCTQVHVCSHGCMHVPWCMCGGQRTISDVSP